MEAANGGKNGRRKEEEEEGNNPNVVISALLRLQLLLKIDWFFNRTPKEKKIPLFENFFFYIFGALLQSDRMWLNRFWCNPVGKGEMLPRDSRTWFLSHSCILKERFWLILSCRVKSSRVVSLAVRRNIELTSLSLTCTRAIAPLVLHFSSTSVHSRTLLWPLSQPQHLHTRMHTRTLSQSCSYTLIRWMGRFWKKYRIEKARKETRSTVQSCTIPLQWTCTSSLVPHFLPLCFLSLAHTRQNGRNGKKYGDALSEGECEHDREWRRVCGRE